MNKIISLNRAVQIARFDNAPILLCGCAECFNKLVLPQPTSEGISAIKGYHYAEIAVTQSFLSTISDKDMYDLSRSEGLVKLKFKDLETVRYVISITEDLKTYVYFISQKGFEKATKPKSIEYRHIEPRMPQRKVVIHPTKDLPFKLDPLITEYEFNIHLVN